MPFKSVAQYHYMFKNLPHLAKKWVKETKISKLPQKVKKGKK